MRKMLILCILIVFAQFFIPVHSEYDTLFVATECLQLTFAWLLVFMLIRKKHIVCRSIAFLFAAHSLLNGMLTVWVPSDALNGFVYAAEGAIFFVTLAFYAVRDMGMPSSEYDPRKRYVAWRRPSGFFDFVLCAFSWPVSGISLISKGVIGKFDRETGRFVVKPFIMSKKYALLEVRKNGDRIDKTFEKNAGAEYDLIRKNCVTILAEVYPSINPFFKTPASIMDKINVN